MFMKVLVKVACILSAFGATIWVYFAICMSCCMRSRANQTFHFQTYDRAHTGSLLVLRDLNAQIHGTQCAFTIKFYNQLLQLCTARTAWSDSVIRSEASSITESDRSGPIR